MNDYFNLYRGQQPRNDQTQAPVIHHRSDFYRNLGLTIVAPKPRP